MDQLHSIQQSVQIESIGATYLGISYYYTAVIHLTSFLFPIPFIVMLEELLSPSQ